MDLSKLLDHFEHKGVDATPVLPYWQKLIEAHRANVQVPAGPSGDDLRRARVELDTLLATKGCNPQLIANQSAKLSEIEYQRVQAKKKKAAAVKAEEAARQTAARETRNLLIRLFDKCAKEIAEIVDQVPEHHKTLPPILPESLREIWSLGVWAQGMMSHHLLSLPNVDDSTGKACPRIRQSLLYMVEPDFRAAVRARCNGEVPVN